MQNWIVSLAPTPACNFEGTGLNPGYTRLLTDTSIRSDPSQAQVTASPSEIAVKVFSFIVQHVSCASAVSLLRCTSGESPLHAGRALPQVQFEARCMRRLKHKLAAILPTRHSSWLQPLPFSVEQTRLGKELGALLPPEAVPSIELRVYAVKKKQVEKTICIFFECELLCSVHH